MTASSRAGDKPVFADDTQLPVPPSWEIADIYRSVYRLPPPPRGAENEEPRPVVAVRGTRSLYLIPAGLLPDHDPPKNGVTVAANATGERFTVMEVAGTVEDLYQLAKPGEKMDRERLKRLLRDAASLAVPVYYLADSRTPVSNFQLADELGSIIPVWLRGVAVTEVEDPWQLAGVNVDDAVVRYIMRRRGADEVDETIQNLAAKASEYAKALALAPLTGYTVLVHKVVAVPGLFEPKPVRVWTVSLPDRAELKSLLAKRLDEVIPLAVAVAEKQPDRVSLRDWKLTPEELKSLAEEAGVELVEKPAANIAAVAAGHTLIAGRPTLIRSVAVHEMTHTAAPSPFDAVRLIHPAEKEAAAELAALAGASPAYILDPVERVAVLAEAMAVDPSIRELLPLTWENLQRALAAKAPSLLKLFNKRLSQRDVEEILEELKSRGYEVPEEIIRILDKTPQELTPEERRLLLRWALLEIPGFYEDVLEYNPKQPSTVAEWVLAPRLTDIPGVDTPDAKKEAAQLIRRRARLLTHSL